MRAVLFALLLCIQAAPARAQDHDGAYWRSLERIFDVMARLDREFCSPGVARITQGGIDGINAMPERRDASPLHMTTPGIEGFADVYGQVLETTDNDAALERAVIDGMIAAIDPGGSFYSDRDFFDRSGNVYITFVGGVGPHIVSELLQEGPAAHAGVQVGDELIAIDGATLQGLRREDVAQRLSGDAGSTVSLTLNRAGAALTVSMQRARIGEDGPTASWRVRDGIGIITVATFKEDTARLVQQALEGIRREVREPRRYIVDLRDSPGGLFDQVIDVANQFIDGGAIVSTRPVAQCQAADIQRYNGRRGHNHSGAAPVVVLINGGTASGAEAVAAALRDRRNARLVGQNTFGNASVHTVIPLNAGRDGMLRITLATLHSPSEATWQSVGLAPDITTEPRTPTSDPAMERALALLNDTAPQERLNAD